MSLIDVTYPAWMDRAACNGVNPEIFYPKTGQTAAAARAICRECPVRAACLQWALDTSAEHGVFGGVVPRDRRRLASSSFVWQCDDCLKAFRSRRGLALHAGRHCGAVLAHGTHVTYGSGCRCAPCKAAHAAYMRRRRAERVA